MNRSLRDAGCECVVMVTPVSRYAAAAAVITRATSGVTPLASVITLSIPALIEVPAMPSQMSRTKSWIRGSGSSMSFPGPWKPK